MGMHTLRARSAPWLSALHLVALFGHSTRNPPQKTIQTMAPAPAARAAASVSVLGVEGGEGVAVGVRGS